MVRKSESSLSNAPFIPKLPRYRQKMASAKLVGALVYMDMGRVNVDARSFLLEVQHEVAGPL